MLHDAILRTIHDAGYIVRRCDDGETYTVEAQDLRDGQRYVVRAPEPEAAAVRLAMMLGFELEE